MHRSSTAWKVSEYGNISGPYFPVFGLNTEIFSVNLRIQSEYWKIRTKNNSVFGNFSGSVQSFIPITIWIISMFKWLIENEYLLCFFKPSVEIKKEVKTTTKAIKLKMHESAADLYCPVLLVILFYSPHAVLHILVLALCALHCHNAY